MQFNRYGNLDGGIVPVNHVGDIHAFFVSDFPNSTTRERNFNGMLSFFKLLKEGELGNYITKVWIDGSFTSNKVDPNDIDLIVVLDASPKNIIKLDTYLTNNWGTIRVEAHNRYCDVYAMFDVETVDPSDITAYHAFDKQRKYWMGQFGFDRSMKPKGVIELTNIQEGDDNDA